MTQTNSVRIPGDSRRTLVAATLLVLLALFGCAPVGERPSVATAITLETLPLGASEVALPNGVKVKPVMVAEIPGVAVDLISVAANGTYTEPGVDDVAVVWLVLDGQGTMRTGESEYPVQGETIARAPQGWDWTIQGGDADSIHLLRVRQQLTPDDLEDLKSHPEFQASAHVKQFLECPAYGEAIKSPKTISRTLLPEHYVPRMAMGTVETTGPDEVGAHSHPMLEQLFLGLRGNDITVTADESSANLREHAILHIPLGSHHGAQVAGGKKMHYVWMDFFMTKEGQEWLQMHKPLE